MAITPALTGSPASTRGGITTANDARVDGATTVVLAVPETFGSLSDATVTDCRPAVASVTWNVARPALKTTSMSGSVAAVSVLATVAVPLNVVTSRPPASTARAATVVGTPALVWVGMRTINFVATSGAATVVVADAERAASAESVAVSVCDPAVRNVTGTNAVPLTSVTVDGRVAAVSEDEIVAAPE